MVNGKITIARHHYFTITWEGVDVENQVSYETAVTPNTVHHFLVEVEGVGGGTAVRVKVWQDGTAEPATWQINTTDSSSFLTLLRHGLLKFAVDGILPIHSCSSASGRIPLCH